MQNSLDRLFDGITNQILEVILPGLSDPYARSQALAVVELLGNMKTRVEWRCDQLREVVEEVRAALGDAVPDPAGLENAELLEARRQALAGLAQAQAAGREDLLEVAGRLLDAELGRLQTGMYRR